MSIPQEVWINCVPTAQQYIDYYFPTNVVNAERSPRSPRVCQRDLKQRVECSRAGHFSRQAAALARRVIAGRRGTRRA
jgi:hypothetical protein